jgi:hypothetical protein
VQPEKRDCESLFLVVFDPVPASRGVVVRGVVDCDAAAAGVAVLLVVN